MDLSQSLTRWHNPTSRQAVLDIFVGPGVPRGTVTIPPGEERSIPSMYDSAIHHVQGGQIVGGLAPSLVKLGAVEPPLHKTLVEDLDKQAEAEAAEKAKVEAKAKAEAEAKAAAAAVAAEAKAASKK